MIEFSVTLTNSSPLQSAWLGGSPGIAGQLFPVESASLPAFPRALPSIPTN